MVLCYGKLYNYGTWISEREILKLEKPDLGDGYRYYYSTCRIASDGTCSQPAHQCPARGANPASRGRDADVIGQWALTNP